MRMGGGDLLQTLDICIIYCLVCKLIQDIVGRVVSLQKCSAC